MLTRRGKINQPRDFDQITFFFFSQMNTTGQTLTFHEIQFEKWSPWVCFNSWWTDYFLRSCSKSFRLLRRSGQASVPMSPRFITVTALRCLLQRHKGTSRGIHTPCVLGPHIQEWGGSGPHGPNNSGGKKQKQKIQNYRGLFQIFVYWITGYPVYFTFTLAGIITNGRRPPNRERGIRKHECHL